jgi:hypothetical protein
MDSSGVYCQVNKAEFRQTLEVKIKTAIGTLVDCIRDRFLGDPVDERRCICNCFGMFSRKRRADFDELGDKEMRIGRCGLSTVAKSVTSQRICGLISSRFRQARGVRRARGSSFGMRVIV